MQTRIYKGRDGWQATSDIVLNEISATEKEILHFLTCKRNGGMVQTTVTRMIYADKGGPFASRSFKMFGDYHATVASLPPGTRCTEKSVTECHKAALEKLEQIKAECALFYANKADRAA